MTVSREECRELSGRIHIRMDEVNDRTIRIEETAKHMQNIAESMKETSDNLIKLMYGNGRDGMVTRLGKVQAQVTLQWALLTIVVMAVFGSAVYIIRYVFTTGIS